MTDTWIRILKDYPNRFGPTVPFILGALRHPVGSVLPAEKSREELRALLVAMRDEAPDHYSVVIQGCVNLAEPIARLSDDPPSGFLPIDSPFKEKGALCTSSLFMVYPSMISSRWLIGFGIDMRRISPRDAFHVETEHGQAFDETELAPFEGSLQHWVAPNHEGRTRACSGARESVFTVIPWNGAPLTRPGNGSRSSCSRDGRSRFSMMFNSMGCRAH
jgi:hypothetical protein